MDPPGNVVERFALWARLFEECGSTLQDLTVLLVSVTFAVLLDITFFKTSPWVLLMITVVVIFSSVPDRFGAGLVVFVEKESPSAATAVLGLNRKEFLRIRLAKLGIKVAQFVLSILPMNCEVGDASIAFCRQVEPGVTLVSGGTIMFILVLSMVDALLFIIASVMFLMLSRHVDAGYYFFRIYRAQIGAQHLRYMYAKKRMRLPDNDTYIARHLYKLVPYRGIRWPEHVLLERFQSGFSPKLMLQRIVPSQWNHRVDPWFSKDIITHVNDKKLQRDRGGGGWFAYFFRESAWRHLMTWNLKELTLNQREDVLALIRYFESDPMTLSDEGRNQVLGHVLHGRDIELSLLDPEDDYIVFKLLRTETGNCLAPLVLEHLPLYKRVVDTCKVMMAPTTDLSWTVVASPSFKVLTYNILAPSHADKNAYAAPGILDWSVRRLKLVERIRDIDPNIFALQELEDFSYFARGFSEYDSAFHARAGLDEGCSLWWKKEEFQCHGQIHIDLNDIAHGDQRFQRNNVAVAVLLQQKPVGNKFVFATIHTTWNPKNEDIKLRQVEYAAQRIEAFCQQHGTESIVWVGDFNALPNDPVYQLLVDGNRRYLSAYKAVDHPSTTFTPDFCACVDYIFYSNAHVDKVLGLAAAAVCPSQSEPSDHLPICAVMKIPF